MEKKVALVITLVMLFQIPVAFSMPSNLAVSPNPLWLDSGKTITVSFMCGTNETAGNVQFMNSNYVFQCQLPTLSNGIYTSVCDLSSYAEENIYGQYSVRVECIGNTTTNATIQGLVNKLMIESLDVQTQNIYSGDDLKISFKVRKNDQYLCSGITSDVYLDDNIVVAKNANPLCEISTNQLRLTLPTSNLGELPEGWYDLKLDISYTENGMHKASRVEQAAVYVKPTYTVSLLSSEPVSVIGDADVTIPVKVMKKGSAMKGLDASNFRLKIYRGASLYRTVEPSSVDENQDSYSVKFFIADLPSGEYSGEIRLMVGGVQVAKTEKFSIESKMPLVVGFVDSRGRAYDGTLIVKSNTFSRSFRAGSDGLIEDSVIAGNYTIIITVSGMKITLYGVSINSGLENPFRFDFLDSIGSLEGINVASLYVFESAVPFSSAVVELSYDDSKVYDEQRLNVYTCRNWNYGRRVCSSDWEDVENVVKDTVRNVVRFNTTHFSAFVIGERKQLFFSAEMPKDRFFRGENMLISGKVVDSNNNPVEGVKVVYSFEGLNATGSGMTDAAGFFNILAEAPDVEGNVKLVLAAEKNPYIPAKMSAIIEIYSKPDVEITVPQSITTEIGTKTNFTIDVMNTGQTNMSSLKISVTGLDPKWYDFFPQFMDLNVGEKKTVTVFVKIPEEDCMERQCKDFYFLKVKAWNDDVSREETTTVKLKLKPSVQQANPISEITAKLIAMPAEQWAFSVVILGIFTSFMMFGKRVKNSVKKRVGKGFSFSFGKSKEDRMERLTQLKSTLKVETERHPRIRTKPFRFKFKKRD